MRERNLKPSTNKGFFVSLIEKLFQVKLRSYSLCLAVSLWAAIKISMSVFTIVFVGDLYFGIEPKFFNSAHFAFELAILIFFTMFLFGFLYHSAPMVLRKARNKKIVFTLSIMAVGLALLAYTSLTFQTTSIPADLSKEQCFDQVRTCDVEKEIDGIAKTSNERATNHTDNTSSKLNHTDSHQMTIQKFNEMREEYGIDEFSIEDRTKYIEQTLADLFSEDEIESWDEYLEELDEVAISKPAYTQVHISRAISNEVPFHILTKILARGHELTGNHVSMLASTLSVEQFVILENYGVNIAAPSSTGSNALVSSLFNKERDQMFNYFILNDRLAFSDEIDIFKAILETSSILKFDTSYARKALEHGVPVSENAKIWIESELKNKDIRFYEEVKRSLNIGT